jgi:hypothetical protein
VRTGRFFVLPDPINEAVIQRRAADLNAFLEARLAALIV